MELVTYVMIALIALGSCLDWPGLVNHENSDRCNSTMNSRMEQVIFSNPDYPSLIKDKYEHGPGGPIEPPPDSTSD